MWDVERNLDELFDYTQGIIKELQQKTKIASKPELSNPSPTLCLNSFKKIREDMLKYKAWHKKQASPFKDTTTEADNTSKLSILEKQWRNQKFEASPVQPLSASSVIYSRPTDLTTPLKPNKVQPERSYTEEAQALPYDDFKISQEERIPYPISQDLQAVADKQYRRRSQSAQRRSVKKDSSNNGSNVQNPLVTKNSEDDDNSTRVESRNSVKCKRSPIERTPSPSLKPSRSMSESKLRRPQTPEQQQLNVNKIYKKTPKLEEVMRFLLQTSGNSSSGFGINSENNNVIMVKPPVVMMRGERVSSTTKVEAGVLRESRESRESRETLDHHYYQQNNKKGYSILNKNMNEWDTNKVKSGYFQEEISMIEPKEKSGGDLDISDSISKLFVFSKRPSTAMNDNNQDEKAGNSQKGAKVNGNNPMSVTVGGNNTEGVRRERPLRPANIDTKNVGAKYGIERDGEEGEKEKSTGIKSAEPQQQQQRTSKWKIKNNENIILSQKENTQQEKSNENGNLYSQIMGRTQHGEIKSAIDFSKKKTIGMNGMRTSSINKAQSRGGVEMRVEEAHNKSATKGRQASNEGDRLYKEILEKLNKERNMKANPIQYG